MRKRGREKKDGENQRRREQRKTGRVRGEGVEESQFG